MVLNFHKNFGQFKETLFSSSSSPNATRFYRGVVVGGSLYQIVLLLWLLYIQTLFRSIMVLFRFSFRFSEIMKILKILCLLNSVILRWIHGELQILLVINYWRFFQPQCIKSDFKTHRKNHWISELKKKNTFRCLIPPEIFSRFYLTKYVVYNY